MSTTAPVDIPLSPVPPLASVRTVPPSASPALAVAKKYAEVCPAPILNLHRHEDGYIAFATERDGDDFRPLVSIKASELETWFPLYRDQLLKDSYVGINADWRLRNYGAQGDAYGYPLHRSDRLRYINACYVDIDTYKLGLDVGTVIGRIINLQDSGQMPHASMIVRSGQGLWLLWLIHDVEDLELSQRAFPDKLDIYARIQNAIIERLLPLGADMAARDAARHLRIPGSLNTTSETNVEWWVQGCNQSGYVYSLPQLAKLFKAIPSRRHHGELVAHNPAKRRGWVALNARRLRDFNVLRSLRGGGFSEGCRNNAAKVYAWLLRCNALGSADVHGMVSAMAGQCHPRLPVSSVKDAVRYSKRMRRMLDQTIADWLNITRAEAEVLEGFPPSTRSGGREPSVTPMPRQLQRRAVVERRAAIQAIISDTGYVPDVRTMSRLICAQGFRGNHQTVFTDYKALGVEWERTLKAREERRVSAKQCSLYCLQGSLDNNGDGIQLVSQ